MSRTYFGTFLIASLAACSSAYADRAAPPSPPVAVSPARSPFDVEILDDGDVPLRTYQHRGRFYVLGEHGDRYVIRVTNPTPNRIEAVITVDGLDVVDGEAGDLHKRGYIVPAFGEVRIEGFRTSTSDVATFRFSSVADSYAGRKGKARNVGVIAVAIFAEQAPAQVIIEPPSAVPMDEGEEVRPSGRATIDGSGDGAGVSAGRGPSPTNRPPARPSRMPPPTEPPAVRPADPSPSGGAPRHADKGGAPTETSECCAPRPSRPGLGTEFGESRFSQVTFTRFVRSSTQPIAIAELRYNDAAGLTALGIALAPTPDADELSTRETADPFPGDHRFARPPAGIH